MVRPYIKTSRPALGPTQCPIHCCLPGVKRLGHEGDHSPPPSADVKHDWSCTFAPTICLHSVERKHFYYTTLYQFLVSRTK